MLTRNLPDVEELAEAAGAALETMFFTPVLEPCGAKGPEDMWAVARLEFRGDSRGSFALGLSRDSAFSISENFLGLEIEELSDPGVHEVVCELTNIIAGSLVSRLSSERAFDLTQPAIDNSTESYEKMRSGRAHSFRLEDGFLTLWFDLEE